MELSGAGGWAGVSSIREEDCWYGQNVEWDTKRLQDPREVDGMKYERGVSTAFNLYQFSFALSGYYLSQIAGMCMVTA